MPVHRISGGGSIRRLRSLLLVGRVRRYLKRLAAADPPDVVHWHGHRIDAWFTAKLPRGIGKVFTNHSSMYLELYADRANWPRLHRWHRHADRVIAPSDELREKSEILVPAERTHFISNAVDPQQFQPGPPEPDLRTRWDADNGRVVFVCCRRLEPKNGVIYLVQAMKHVQPCCPEAKLVVVGDGKQETRIREVIRQDGTDSCVLLNGRVSNRQMPGVLHSADVAVLPSLAEATSVAGLEAMACGLPLIGTRVGGIPQIVEDSRTGLLVPPADPKALAEVVCAWRAMQRRAAAWARRPDSACWQNSPGMRSRPKPRRSMRWPAATRQRGERK
jgi:glycosyltransferase involved in cell wall biosynthesis